MSVAVCACLLFALVASALEVGSQLPATRAVPAAPATTIEIAAGVHMPMVMLGTWYLSNIGSLPFNGRFPHCPFDECSKLAHQNVKAWLNEAGGRGIDTAFDYQSQPGVGQGIRESGVPREEVFIVSKVPGTLGYNKTIEYVNRDIEQLGVKQIDLMLLHFCNIYESQDIVRKCTAEGIAESWRALEDLYFKGTVRGIGVSNFCIHQMDLVMQHARVKPMVNQVERHPGYTQDAMIQYAKEHGVTVIGYEPLAAHDWCPVGMALFWKQGLQQIAQAHNVSEAQVLLRWQVQNGVAVNPRVGGLLHPWGPNIDHMRQNLATMAPGAFNLTNTEMKQIDELGAIGSDNSYFNKCSPLAYCPENHGGASEFVVHV